MKSSTLTYTVKIVAFALKATVSHQIIIMVRYSCSRLWEPPLGPHDSQLYLLVCFTALEHPDRVAAEARKTELIFQ